MTLPYRRYHSVTRLRVTRPYWQNADAAIITFTTSQNMFERHTTATPLKSLTTRRRQCHRRLSSAVARKKAAAFTMSQRATAEELWRVVNVIDYHDVGVTYHQSGMITPR